MEGKIIICPGCGAPVHGSGVSKCEYCGSAVNTGSAGMPQGVELPDTREGMEILQALQSGNLIGAVKGWRSMNGTDLKTSKEAVEQLHASLRQSFPDQYQELKRKGKLAGGCMLFLLIGVPLIGISLGLFKACGG